MNIVKILCLFSVLSFWACTATTEQSKTVETTTSTTTTVSNIEKITKTDAEWKAQLSEEEYYILRKKGTERSFTGDLLENKATGTYTCSGCELPLFESDTKFKSGTGWPSFWKAIEGNVAEDVDNTHGMRRVEILCNRCDGHLGHVFDDGPKPTGLRYCVNSVSLNFVEKK